MINVNINEEHLKELLADGFLLEHGENTLTIRNGEGKPLAEIIYIEETNDILIMDDTRSIWCKKITNIMSVNDISIMIDYEVLQYPNFKHGNMHIANI